MFPNTTRILATAILAIMVVISVQGLPEDLCEDPEFDTIFSTGAPNDSVYIFKGDDYWELELTASGESYALTTMNPKKINSFWPDLPGNINAAFTNYTENVTYFFKGNQYWQYSGQTKMTGFPKLISEGFPGIPNDIKIAFRCSGKVYFFKDDEYYTFKPSKSPPLGPKNPKSIAGSWKGLPDGVTAAVQLSSGEVTHFFQGTSYYKLQVSNASVLPTYPVNYEPLWLACDDIAQPSAIKLQDLCKDPQFDTIFSTTDNKVYVIKASDYWLLIPKTNGDGYKLADGYPKPVNSYWKELPSGIDTALTKYTEGKTYFFKGAQYWRYSGQVLEAGYPKPISQGFPNIPNDLDVWYICPAGINYFSKGKDVWSSYSSSPRPIPKVWTGLPSDLTAAVQLPHAAHNYFFRGTQFYKFKRSHAAVEVASPPYPHDNKKFWLGCPDET